MKDAIISVLAHTTDTLGIQSVLTDDITVQTYIQKMNFLDSRDAIIMEHIWLRLSPIPGMLELRPHGASIQKESPVATLLKKTALIMNGDDACVESLWNAMEQSRYLNRSGIRRKAMHMYYGTRRSLHDCEYQRVLDIDFDVLHIPGNAYFTVLKEHAKTYHKAPVYRDNIPNIDTWNMFLKHGLRHLVSVNDEHLIYTNFIQALQEEKAQNYIKETPISRYVIDQTPKLYKEYLHWLWQKNYPYTHPAFNLGDSENEETRALVYDIVFTQTLQSNLQETELFLN